jgi:hypothetical protein
MLAGVDIAMDTAAAGRDWARYEKLMRFGRTLENERFETERKALFADVRQEAVMDQRRREKGREDLTRAWDAEELAAERRKDKMRKHEADSVRREFRRKFEALRGQLAELSRLVAGLAELSNSQDRAASLAAAKAVARAASLASPRPARTDGALARPTPQKGA